MRVNNFAQKLFLFDFSPPKKKKDPKKEKTGRPRVCALPETILTSTLEVKSDPRLWSYYKRRVMTLVAASTAPVIALLFLDFPALLHFEFPVAVRRPSYSTEK